MAAPLKMLARAEFTILRTINQAVRKVDQPALLSLSSHTRVIACAHQHVQPPLIQQARHVTFYTSLTAGELWSGVVGATVNNKKRARGKRTVRKKITDLNRGQELGVGKANIVWPGLNAPVLKGREVVERKALPPNPDRVADLIKLRDRMSKIRYPRLSPLMRGWSGKRFPGQKIDPPDPVEDYVFEGFTSRVLEFRTVSHMTGGMGRKNRFRAFVVVGNGQGLAGYGMGKSLNGRAALRQAKNRAAKKLMQIPLYEDHTVYHNLFSQFHHSKLFVKKKEKGHGVVAHRAIKTICEVIGIKDLYCKVEGASGSVVCITKAFFQGLQDQETHQQLSDRSGLHVVEYRRERGQFPMVIASPSSGIVKDKVNLNEEEEIEFDYNRLYYGNKVPLEKPKKMPFYATSEGYKKRMGDEHRRRNQKNKALEREAGLW